MFAGGRSNNVQQSHHLRICFCRTPNVGRVYRSRWDFGPNAHTNTLLCLFAQNIGKGTHGGSIEICAHGIRYDIWNCARVNVVSAPDRAMHVHIYYVWHSLSNRSPTFSSWCHNTHISIYVYIYIYTYIKNSTKKKLCTFTSIRSTCPMLNKKTRRDLWIRTRICFASHKVMTYRKTVRVFHIIMRHTKMYWQRQLWTHVSCVDAFAT